MPGKGERIDYFNPHSPRGERQGADGNDVQVKIFQSTLPARGATYFR